MKSFYLPLLMLLMGTFFIGTLRAQTITCDSTNLQEFYTSYGGTNAFSTHTQDAINTFIQTEDEIAAGNYSQAQTLLNNIFNTYPKGSNLWWNVFNDPNGANLGTPHAYYGLRMMEDILDYHLNSPPPQEVQTANMKIVLVGCSQGIQPTTETQLTNGTGPFVTNNLDPNLRADDYCIIKQSFHLFRQYVTAITKGQLQVEVEFIELPTLCMDVNVSTSPPLVASGSIQPVWDALSDEAKDTTDWWWVLYPSHVPDFPTFDDEAFITGGMGADSKGGPVFIIDDKWLVRKPPHLGDGIYNDIERRIYLPQWLQHEFFHHLYRIYPEFSLEVNGHDWFDRSFWASDFVGQFETDYYSETLHKRLQTACVPLARKLITRNANDLQAFFDDLVMEDLVGNYSLDNIGNPWHEGEILKVGNNYFWRNKANVQWSVTPNLSDGKLETGSDSPYPGQDFFIEFYQTSEGDFIPGMSGLKFQGESYKRRFDLIRESVPVEIVFDLYESKCLDSLLDSGNILKQAGQIYWGNDTGELWELSPTADNERFTLGNDSSTPGEEFTLVIVENTCGLAVLGFEYLDAYYWRRKRDTQNPSPALINPVADLELPENFGTHQIDLSNVFEDTEAEDLFLFASSSDPALISTEITGQQLVLTGNQWDSVTILLMALDFNGGLVMNKFKVKVDNTVSIEDIELTEPAVSIFPNPIKEFVQILGQPADYEVSLYSLNREIVQESSRFTTEIQLNTQDLSSGIYFLVIRDRNTGKVKTEKLIKY